MEIQGHSDARNRNIHSQHGVLHGTCFDLAVANTGGLQDLSKQHDNSNHARPRTSLFHLPVENGSQLACSPTSTRSAKVQPDTATVVLRNVNIDKEIIASLGTQKILRMPVKSGIAGDDIILQKELPQIEGGEVVRQRQLPFPLPVLRLHPKDGAAKVSFVARPKASVPGILNSMKETDGSVKSLFISRGEDRPTPSHDEEGKLESKWTELSEVWQSGTTEAPFCNSHVGRNHLDIQKRTEQAVSDLSESSVVDLKDTVSQHTVQGNDLSNKYDHICDQSCSENVKDKVVSQSLANQGSSLIPASVGFVEVTDKSELNLYTMGLQDNLKSAHDSFLSPSTCEPFHGNITINNQNLIVTIENGILTLASPSERRKEDIVSLKEHLLLTDHKDIVLLNYDSGSKSIGTISSLAVATSNYQKGPQTGLLVSDTELALVDDCSLSEFGTSLESYFTVKKETEVFCAVADCDVVSSSPRAEDCDRDDIRPLALVKSKKENVSSFSCPEPGCSCIFITRQKLKVHLLNHTEDPRPYQCSVDGCGWAFATSYKLKRHLQSHNKQRPHICQFEGCGRSFTTVYNLKAHVKVHEQDNAFICEICSERFHSATRLTNHQKVHFEPQRPHKCEFPGCGKTFITFSALFSHNRTHFRETGQFLCNYPGCDKMYDKACRLKIHLRSHTGERPFVCDSEGCGWSFTSMSKLLRHKRKHDDDRRFVCTEEGCGKSFTRAEHLKGHSITHLGTKPFHCHAEGCSAKFSARSSLYIHSKKHKQDADSSRSRCPLTNCFKHFSSRSNLKSHIVKHHQLNADILNQMEIQPTLTPSSELISSPPMNTAGHGGTGGDQLPSLDLGSMLSAVPEGTICSAGIGVGMSSSSSTFTMDLSLVSPSILTIDPSVGSLPGTSTSNSSDKVADPINLAASANTGPAGDVITPKGTFNLDDMTVSPRVLRSLTSLTMHDCEASLDPSLEHPIRPSNTLNQEPSTSLANASAPELLDLPSKVVELGGPAGAGTLPGCVEVLGAQESGKVSTQLVYPRSSSSTKKDTDPNLVSPSSILDDPASDGDLAFQLSTQPTSSHSQLTVDLPVNILQEPSVMPEDDNASDNTQFTGSTINLQDLE
uniref:Zinc finger protein ZXDC-like n=1 Tax=Gouania willdenowi TaxID=441366 RepID=A0A8C5DUN5_GOUWI